MDHWIAGSLDLNLHLYLSKFASANETTPRWLTILNALSFIGDTSANLEHKQRQFFNKMLLVVFMVNHIPVSSY